MNAQNNTLFIAQSAKPCGSYLSDCLAHIPFKIGFLDMYPIQ